MIVFRDDGEHSRKNFDNEGLRYGSLKEIHQEITFIEKTISYYPATSECTLPSTHRYKKINGKYEDITASGNTTHKKFQRDRLPRTH